MNVEESGGQVQAGPNKNMSVPALSGILDEFISIGSTTTTPPSTSASLYKLRSLNGEKKLAVRNIWFSVSINNFKMSANLIWLGENRENIRRKSILLFYNHDLYDERQQQSWFGISGGRFRYHFFTCHRECASTRTQWSTCTMYVNFQKKHNVFSLYFVNLIWRVFLSNRVWCMWRS